MVLNQKVGILFNRGFVHGSVFLNKVKYDIKGYFYCSISLAGSGSATLVNTRWPDPDPLLIATTQLHFLCCIWGAEN